jgi:hypothetical protein
MVAFAVTVSTVSFEFQCFLKFIHHLRIIYAGSVVLPILGAVPDGCIVLFSGLGPNAAEELAVGKSLKI